MYDELVKRLRSHNGWALNKTLDEAADAIEQLSADLERSKEWEGFWKEQAEEAKGKLQQYALAVANKPRWIPVTERLPEGRIQVLVCSGFFAPFTEVAFFDGMWYSAWDGETEIEAVTHWMPLPEPPKEE